MRKFNIGDKIKVIGNCNGHGCDIGGEYTIKCYVEYCTEPNENGYAYRLNGDVECYIIREKDMELVTPKEYIDYCNNDVSVLKTTKIVVDALTKGEWKNMKNKVLELWYERKGDAIIKEYEEKEREFHNSKGLVIKYKEILDRFENELEELYKSEENQEQNYIINTMTNNVYEYNINYKKLHDEFGEKYIRERSKKLRDLDELKKEIEAQLSLSDDLEYQVDVLTRYGVLDKKTKKMVV